MVTLDQLLDSDPKGKATSAAQDVANLFRAGLYGIGWAVAKAVYLVLLILGGSLYGIGWVARRIIWPAMVWTGAAVQLGWEDARKGGHGPG